MPNWVENRLTVSGKDEKNILNKYIIKTPNEISKYAFDFNKIIEMPKELAILSGCITEDCINVYLSSLSQDEYLSAVDKLIKSEPYLQIRNNHYKRISDKEVNDIVNKYIKFTSSSKGMLDDPIIKNKDDAISYGKKAVDNVRKYGSKDWYDWCIKNWGTKWNACETVYDESCPTEVSFQTAWSDVRNLIVELSRNHPNNTFYYEYAEEQLGCYTGICVIKNGEIQESAFFEDGSKEAYDLAFELWGEENKEFFKFNKKTKTYEFIEDGGNEDAEM